MGRVRRNHILWPLCVKIGVLVLVKDGNEWCRGTIIGHTGSTASIHLGNWSRIITKPVTQLYLMHENFIQEPWFTFYYGLWGIKPVGTAAYWPKKTQEIAKLGTEGQKGWIRIKESLEGKAADIDLYLGKANYIG